MIEDVSPEIRQKIDNIIEKLIVLFLDKNSKGNSLEELVKSLITERVFSKLGPRLNRYMVRKAAKKLVRKAVDRIWERHKEKLLLKLQSLK